MTSSIILTLVGTVRLGCRNFREDTAVPNSKMQAATLVLEGKQYPCVVHSVEWGKPESCDPTVPQRTSLAIFGRVRHTPHTKRGFVSVQFTQWPTLQFSTYVHIDHLDKLLAVFAKTVVHSELAL